MLTYVIFIANICNFYCSGQSLTSVSYDVHSWYDRLHQCCICGCKYQKFSRVAAKPHFENRTHQKKDGRVKLIGPFSCVGVKLCNSFCASITQILNNDSHIPKKRDVGSHEILCPSTSERGVINDWGLMGFHIYFIFYNTQSGCPPDGPRGGGGSQEKWSSQLAHISVWNGGMCGCVCTQKGGQNEKITHNMGSLSQTYTQTAELCVEWYLFL